MWHRWPRPRPRCSSWKSWAARGLGSRPRADWRRKKTGDAPHVLLFPELTFDQDKFLAKVDDAVHKHGYCAVGVSEGIKNAGWKFVRIRTLVDAFGHAQVGRWPR